jgi:hypothetical protein
MKRRLVPVLLAVVLCTSCVKNQPYRIAQPTLPKDPSSQVQRLYSIAFVEFDDMGEFWDRTQLDKALQVIDQANKDSGGKAVVITFIHGWKHNASDDSMNVFNFRKSLQALATSICTPPGTSSPDYGHCGVVGVYIGWRGALVHKQWSTLKQLSYFNRRDAAARIAGPNVTETLLSIMRRTKRSSEAVSVTVGHSFGGLLLEQALSQSLLGLILNESTHEHEEQQATGPRSEDPSSVSASPTKSLSPADLIVFVNQAANAMTARQMIGALHKHQVKVVRNGDPQPMILSLTSAADGATGYLLPIAQTPSTWFKRFRSYQVDANGDIADGHSPPGIVSQKKYYTTAPAFLPELQSHQLRRSPAPEDCPAPLRRVTLRMSDDPKPLIEGFCIEPRKDAWNTTPYWVMQLPKSVVPDHGTIFTPRFVDLLAGFLPAPSEMAPNVKRSAPTMSVQ